MNRSELEQVIKNWNGSYLNNSESQALIGFLIKNIRVLQRKESYLDLLETKCNRLVSAAENMIFSVEYLEDNKSESLKCLSEELDNYRTFREIFQELGL